MLHVAKLYQKKAHNYTGSLSNVTHGKTSVRTCTEYITSSLNTPQHLGISYGGALGMHFSCVTYLLSHIHK